MRTDARSVWELIVPLNFEPDQGHAIPYDQSKPGASQEPLIRKIDCIQIPVPDLEAGLRFYRDGIGHSLIWRTRMSAGLRLPDSDAELVIQTERKELEANLLVESVDKAVARVEEAGGKAVVDAFDIRSGDAL